MPRATLLEYLVKVGTSKTVIMFQHHNNILVTIFVFLVTSAPRAFGASLGSSLLRRYRSAPATTPVPAHLSDSAPCKVCERLEYLRDDIERANMMDRVLFVFLCTVSVVGAFMWVIDTVRIVRCR